jgi:hypothetical protein
MLGFNGHNACGVEDGIIDPEKDVFRVLKKTSLNKKVIIYFIFYKTHFQ